jgi:hypothetical protein
MNDENLKPRQLTNEEATKIGRRGGINSGKARREKRAFKEIMLKMLNSNISAEQAKKLGMFNLLCSKDMTFNAAVAAQQMVKALKGDTNAAKFVLETSGQKEADKVESTVSLKTSELTDEELEKRLAELNRKLE